MFMQSPMASDKGVNEVCGLIKNAHCIINIDIIKLLKRHCLLRRYAKQTKVQMTAECKLSNFDMRKVNHSFTDVTANKDELATVDVSSLDFAW